VPCYEQNQKHAAQNRSFIAKIIPRYPKQ